MFRRGVCVPLYCFCFWFCITAFFILVFAILIFSLIFRPREPTFAVTNASLTQFNFTTTNSTLRYNLSLNFTIQNPNDMVGIYYRRILVIGNYRKKRFALVKLTSTPFYQGHKNTTIVHTSLEGEQLVRFGGRDLSTFNSETANRVYTIDVEIAIRIGLKFGKVKTGYFKIPQKSNCKLKVPLSPSGGFNTTECESFDNFYL